MKNDQKALMYGTILEIKEKKPTEAKGKRL